MSAELRAEIAEVLANAGLANFKDTTTGARPQWRASFSFRGHLHGEASYVHLYVPADADHVQVNCSAASPALDPVPEVRIARGTEEVNAACLPGSRGWQAIAAQLGVPPDDMTGWEALTSPYVGMQHRMILTRVRLPLASLSPRSIDIAVRLGLYLARGTREAVTAEWKASDDSREWATDPESS